MENQADSSSRRLTLENELIRGRDYTRQLQIQLADPSSPREIQEVLVQNIMSSIGRAISVVQNGSLINVIEPNAIGALSVQSPTAFVDSPISGDCDRDFEGQDYNINSGKRKHLPKWTQKVQACSSKGLEGPPEDGYNWRKYGQKDILGAKYPRGYYRCSMQKSHGCQATKQIQRTDEDPTIFDVTYRGNHTCSQQASTQPQQPPRPQTSSPSTSASHGMNNYKQNQEIHWSFGTLEPNTKVKRNYNTNVPQQNSLINYNQQINSSHPFASSLASISNTVPYFSAAADTNLSRTSTWPPNQPLREHNYHQYQQNNHYVHTPQSGLLGPALLINPQTSQSYNAVPSTSPDHATAPTTNDSLNFVPAAAGLQYELEDCHFVSQGF